jgi:exopolyphosphatase / guanosine-5'-triphosphate,3'-diphosphate pyrophosphatase
VLCACIDIGSNTTRLLLARATDGTLEEVLQQRAFTKLGSARASVRPEKIDEVAAAVAAQARLAHERGAERIRAVGTHAIRQAENRDELLAAIAEASGLHVDVLTGEEEARYAFIGATQTLPSLPQGPVGVVDVGGGSTELVLGGPEGVAWHESLDLGCVRVTERFFRSDPPEAGEVDAAREHVRAVLAEHVPAGTAPTRAIGVAGTVTTLAVLSLGLDEEDPEVVDGHELGSAWITGQVERLAVMPVDEIRRLRGMHPDRAPVILAGAVVLAETLRHFGLGRLETSEQDIMHGAALAAAELPERAEGDAPPGAYTCC